MSDSREKKIVLTVGLLVLAAIACSVYVFFSQQKIQKQLEEASEEPKASLIYPKVIVEEPIDPKTLNPKGVLEKSLEGDNGITQANKFGWKAYPVPPRPKSALEKPTVAPPPSKK